MLLRVTLVLIYALNGAFGDPLTTLRVDMRVKILKDQLERDLRGRHALDEEMMEPIEEPIEELREGNRDEDDGDFVTPIMDYDYQKKYRERHRPIKTSKEPTTTDSDDQLTFVAKAKNIPAIAASLNSLRQLSARQSPKAKRPKAKQPNKMKKNKVAVEKTQPVSSSPPSSKALDIFYRKAFYNNVDLDATVPTVHCAAMVSPYFSGSKNQLAMMKVVTKKDHMVLRLIQLLNINTTDFVRDEVYSVLYQISKLKIRIWGWDLGAMNMLINVITREKEKASSFKQIKAGLKRMFDGWKLDRSNTSRLLLQARVYRPPCLRQNYSGSSRFVPGSTIATKANAREFTASVECQNRKHNHYKHRRQHFGATVAVKDSKRIRN